jgi:FK506-binding protein 4/5
MALSFLTDDMLMQLFGDYLAEANKEKLPAHLNLAACFLAERRFKEAIDQASRALSVDRTSAKAYYRRGRARQALGQDDDARKDLLEALRHSPGGEDAAALRALRELETEAIKAARARKKTFGGLFGHEREGDDDSSSSSSEDAEEDEDEEESDPRRFAEREARSARRSARANKRAAFVRDAEARMNDVDEADANVSSEMSKDTTGGSSSFVAGGLVSRLFKTLGFGGRR